MVPTLVENFKFFVYLFISFYYKIKLLLLVNTRIPHQKKWRCTPAPIIVKYPLHFVVSHVQPVHSITNQELFEKHLCNRSSHYEKYRQFPLQREAITCYHLIDTYTVSQDEWDTKEGTGKSMKNALYVLQYSKRHLSGRSNVKK